MFQAEGAASAKALKWELDLARLRSDKKAAVTGKEEARRVVGDEA